MAQTYLKDIHGKKLTCALAHVLKFDIEHHQNGPVYINSDGLLQGDVETWGIHNSDVVLQLIQDYHVAIAFNEKVGWTAKLHSGGYLASSPVLSEAVAYAIIGAFQGVMLDSEFLEL